MSEILRALRVTPRRTRDAFADPIRRLHILVKALRLSLDVAAAVAVLPYQPWLAGPAAIAADYLVYEFCLEPWSKARRLADPRKASLVAPYWEGGPADGERFTYE